MHGILARLRQWWCWGAAQRELEEEIAAHRALKREALARAGVAPERLAAATERAMGNEVYMREAARGVWLWPWLEAIGQGLRQGVSRLGRAKGFAAVAIITLALGMGANTAIFSVVEAVMLRPLPYPEASRILEFRFRSRNSLQDGFPLAWVDGLRQHMSMFSALAGYEGGGVEELDHGHGVDWAAGAYVTSGFFRVFGVTPKLGRGFVRRDETAGAPVVAVLSHALWERAFDGNPRVVGTVIRYDGRACTVVGVMPVGFKFLENPAEMYVALQQTKDLGAQGLNTEIYGRLGPGVSAAAAQAQADAVYPALRRQTELGPWAQGLRLDPYQNQQAMPVQTSLYFLLGIVGLLLLIACANVASLQLARTLARAPELALRRALGAGRGRLFVQFLTEGAVLAVAGGLVGLGLAAATLRTLAVNLKPWSLPLAGPISLDWRVLAFTAAAVCGAAILLAVMAAWQGSAKRLEVARFRRRGRARDVIVTAEIAFSLLLLAGAGLLVRSLASLENAPLGFDPAGRMVFAAQPPHGAAADFQQLLLARLQALPDVKRAAATSALPLLGRGNLPVSPAGHQNQDTGGVEVRMISPGYFAAMGMPLLQGRSLADSDRGSAPLVAAASAGLARQWFGGHSLGRQIRLGVCCGKVLIPPIANPRTLVGVVPDVPARTAGTPYPLTVYIPQTQLQLQFDSQDWFVVQGGVSAAQVRAVVEAVQPGTRVTGVASYATVVSQAVAQPRLEAQLTAGFALLALLLTAVGLYGLLSYAVTERTREIGVRMALGAPRARLLRQVVGRGMVLAVIGVAAGLALAVPLGKTAESLLSGVEPNDPATLAGAAILMLVIAALAGLGPGWRATRVDAAAALRAE
ncbi:MAG: ADOP family duplicated permease [Terriglobales bacterium]